MIKFQNLLLLLALSIMVSNSCTPSESYLMSIKSNLRMVERKDHQSCISKGVELEEWGDVATELYWRCRYILSQDRFINNATSVPDIRNNSMVKKISSKILSNLQRARQAVLSKIEEDIEVFDHSKCISRGFDLDSDDQNINNGYYQCRKKLIYERQPPAPAITNSYEASMNNNQKQFNQYLQNIKSNALPNGSINLALNNVGKYPNCRNVNVNSMLFWDCVDAQEDSKLCLSHIDDVTAKKQLGDKVYCQKQAEVQFPDNYMIAKNKSAKEIERNMRKKQLDIARKEQEVNRKQINQTMQFFESGNVSKDIAIAANNVKQSQSAKDELLNKVQILQLREEFINKCNNMMDQKLPNYIKEQTEKCLMVGKDWRKNISYDYR
ncbi:hypothetical protein N9O56_01960 [Rickettsiales bacterium]|nr:hypothetical protein [Rickettsiales bacterium]